MTRLGLHQLAQSAASDGDIPTWDDSAGLWVPAAPSGAGLPAGGTTGQVLTKQSGTDYDADWETPAGGGGSGFFLDPVTLHATYGDHFTTSTLDAKWNRAGSYVSGDETHQDGGGSWMRLAPRAPGSYYWQTAPAGNFTIVMKGTIIAPASRMFGPLILDNSSNGVAAFHYDNGDGHYAAAVAAGSYSGTGAQFTLTPTFHAASAGVPIWWRLSKVGTSYRTSMSLNGHIWRPDTTAYTGFAGTPTRIGFGGITGTASSFAVDFFDVQ